MTTDRRPGLSRGQRALRAFLIVIGCGVLAVGGFATWLWEHSAHLGEGEARQGADLHALLTYDATIECLEAELAHLRPEADHRAVERSMNDCTDDSFWFTLEGQTHQMLLQHHNLSVVMSTDVQDGQVTFVVDTVGYAESAGSMGSINEDTTVTCWTVSVDVAQRAIAAVDDAECSPDGGGRYHSARHRSVPDLRRTTEQVATRSDAGKSGTVTELHVHQGDALRNGDVVAVIDGVTLIAYTGPQSIEDDHEEYSLYGTRSVATLQRVLKELGYDPGPIDGIRGAGTTSALEAFNADMGLTKDLDSVSHATLVWVGPEQFLVSDVRVEVGDDVDRGDALISGSSAWWPTPEKP